MRLRSSKLWWVLALAAVLVVIPGAGSWWASNAVHAGLFEVRHEPRSFETEVVRADGRTITLRGEDPDLRHPGVLGMAWPGGYAQVGPVLRADGDEVTRELRYRATDGAADGAAQPIGLFVDLEGFAYAGDPLTAHGLRFDTVEVATPAGMAPAWSVPGPRAAIPTTVIFVHGRGAERREALRALPSVHALGYSALVVTYRNDPELPADGPGEYAFGAAEWEDLEAAVRHAVDAGAEEVVLYGYSMGGAIVMSFLERSAEAGRVRAIVLDAPALHLAAIAEHGMRDEGVPGPLTGPLRGAVGWRFDVDWSTYDYLDDAATLQTPLLLFHGAADDVVPVDSSRAFAAAAPAGLVTYVEFPEAGHVRGWNTDRERYEQAIRDFLAPLAAATPEATQQAPAAR